MSINRQKAQAAVDIISDLILSNGRELGSEQHNPRADADASDEYIANREQVVKNLREIRERLENLITGAV